MAGPGNARSAARAARRLWPVAVALYRRWEALPPAEKQRYRRLARENALRAQVGAARAIDRSRTVAGRAWDRRPRRG